MFRVTRDDVVAAVVHRENYPVGEACIVIDGALEAGFALNEIVDVLFYHNIDTLILNTWSRKTFPISGGPL